MSEIIYDINQIRKLLPHSYPFLLVDRLLSVDLEKQSAIALKQVTYNEQFFQGHFDSFPVFPGVLLVESMAQACTLYYCYTNNITPDYSNQLDVKFMSVDNAKFRRPVVPGDSLLHYVQVKTMKRKIYKFQCIATVGGDKVAECNISAMVSSW